jgi:ABC-type multidrug transport system fused ATPase/permease subunit
MRWRDLSAHLKTLREIWPLMADKRGTLALMVVVGLAASIAESLSFSLVLALMYVLVGGGVSIADMTGHPGKLATVMAFIAGKPILTAGLIAGLIFVKGLLTSAYDLLTEWIGGVACSRARIAIFDQYLTGSYAMTGGDDYSTVINRISYDSGLIASTISFIARMMINLGAVLVYGAYIFLISAKIALCVVLLGCALVVTLGLWARRVAETGALASARNEDLFGRMLAGVQALRAIRMFAVELTFAQGFRDASTSVAETSFSRARAEYVSRPIRDIGLLVVLAAILWVSHRGGIGAGAVVTVVALLYRLLPHVTGIEDNLMALLSTSTPLNNVMAILRHKDPPPPGEPAPFDGKFRDIFVDNVSFTYPNAAGPCLAEVSLAIESGDLVAISGPSGCGKTTLVNLLGRLYEPQIGRIVVGDTPLPAIDRRQWLSRLGFAGQDVDLIEGSVADNVRFGRPELTERDIRQALEIAGASEFLDKLADGVATEMGDRGLRMSGGQRQRVGLARAIAGRPDILILDEATNALELALEAAILKRIRSELPGATIIVISHRDNIHDADLVVRMDYGWVQSYVRTQRAGAQSGAAERT